MPPPHSLRQAFRSLTAAALVALLGSTSAYAQGEPALLSPASQTPKVSQAAAADPQVTRQRPVEIDMRPLSEKVAKGGTAFSMELFDGQTVVVDTLRVEQRGPGNYTYFGKVRGQPASEVVLTYLDGHLTADIGLGGDRGSTRSYRIRSHPGAGHWLQEVDAAAFPPDHPDGAERLPAPRLNMLMQGNALGSVDFDKLMQGIEAADDTGATVDLLVVYSNQTATAAGAAIASQIQSAVDRANLAYANSGVTFRLRLVHQASFGYSESGDFSTDLSNLASNATVGALRNTYGADMVSMFIENGAYCGVGYIGPSASSAFTVVNRGCAGSNLSLAHEIGHNFGSRHDPYVDASTSPYAYGHGYAYPAGGWRTVMAYNNACSAAGTTCTRVAYLSNPNVNYNSVPTGTVSTSDNGRVHNQNAYTVANFRAQVTGGCTYALSPTSASVAAAGASGATSVTSGTGCAWNTASNASWLTVGAGSGTSGNGTLNYAAAANNGPARSGALSVGGVAFTVSQANGCSYTVSPTSASFGASASTASVTVTTAPGCTWTATSGASWMSVTAGASGSGNGTVNYSVAANGGALRSGNLTVAGRTVTVSQSAGCTYAFAPTSASVGASGGNGSTSVTAGAGCNWNTTSSASWLTIGAGSSTSGSGTLNYVATTNIGPTRSAAMTVGGATFTVTQSSGCTFTVSPTSATIGASGGTTSVTVSTAAGCSWAASSGVSWMTIGSGGSGTGNGTVTYMVSSNSGALRTGNLAVAGRTVAVTQSAGTVTPTVSATLSPTSMDFGNQPVGTTGNVQSGNFTNTGTSVLTISAIALGGSHPADFAARNVCVVGQTLQPGQSCTVGYAFAPKASGQRSATATITSQAGSKSLALRGSGKNSRTKP